MSDTNEKLRKWGDLALLLVIVALLGVLTYAAINPQPAHNDCGWNADAC